MQYSYYTADVFSDRIFGGNQLAVFPQSSGLTPQQMQKVAAEFNFSETVFIFPPETPQGTRRVRIFTPNTELPFAGHPTVGTAHILAAIGEIPFTEETTIYLEEGVGLVPVTISTLGGQPVYCELTTAKLPEFGSESYSITDLASILSLETDDFLMGEYRPRSVSCGIPFLFIPVKNRIILGKIRFNQSRWQSILSQSWASSVFVFCFDPELEGSDLRARMFAPGLGVMEDPATGSAASALGGYLGDLHPLTEGTLQWTVEQGFEMGRPSILKVTTEKQNGQITEIRVGGTSVLVCQGMMEIPGESQKDQDF